MILTKEIAMSLKSGQTIYTIFNNKRNTTNLKVSRLKITSACKTWKRDTARYELNLKYGLYEYFKITDIHTFELFLTEQEAKTELKMRQVVTALKGN